MISVLGKFFKQAPVDTDCVEQSLAMQAPKVTMSTAWNWVQRGAGSGKNYLIVIHAHNLYDPWDLDETFVEGCFTRRQLTTRLKQLDRQFDATVLQVIDLAQDIDEQFAKATYIERS